MPRAPDLVLTGTTNITASSGVSDSGTFDISGNGNTSIKSLTGTSGKVDLGANTLTVTAASGTFSGTLGASGDAGGFTVSGGTQTLSAVTDELYRGNHDCLGRRSVLTGTTNITASSGVSDSGTFDISGNGNTSIKSLTGTRARSILGASTLTVTAASGTFSGTLQALRPTPVARRCRRHQTLSGAAHRQLYGQRYRFPRRRSGPDRDERTSLHRAASPTAARSTSAATATPRSRA